MGRTLRGGHCGIFFKLMTANDDEYTLVKGLENQLTHQQASPKDTVVIMSCAVATRCCRQSPTQKETTPRKFAIEPSNNIQPTRNGMFSTFRSTGQAVRTKVDQTSACFSTLASSWCNGAELQRTDNRKRRGRSKMVNKRTK